MLEMRVLKKSIVHTTGFYLTLFHFFVYAYLLC